MVTDGNDDEDLLFKTAAVATAGFVGVTLVTAAAFGDADLGLAAAVAVGGSLGYLLSRRFSPGGD